MEELSRANEPGLRTRRSKPPPPRAQGEAQALTQKRRGYSGRRGHGAAGLVSGEAWRFQCYFFLLYRLASSVEILSDVSIKQTHH